MKLSMSSSLVLPKKKAPHRETEIVKVEGIAFPDSYLSEEQQESEVMTESIEEPTSETLATPETFVIEKKLFQVQFHKILLNETWRN